MRAVCLRDTFQPTQAGAGRALAPVSLMSHELNWVLKHYKKNNCGLYLQSNRLKLLIYDSSQKRLALGPGDSIVAAAQPVGDPPTQPTSQ